MTWNPVLTHLRQLLAGLYPTFEGTAENRWHRILAEATVIIRTVVLKGQMAGHSGSRRSV